MKREKLPLVLVVFLFILFTVSGAQAAQIQLTWDVPKTNTDGTPLIVAGYNLYYGHSSKDYQFAIAVGNKTTYTLSALVAGQTYYLTITAYDTSGNESTFSNEVSVTVPSESPSVGDTDGDGIADADETTIYGTDPLLADTDSDGISDGAELAYWGNKWNSDADKDGLINLLDADADNDGVLDRIEISQGFDPADSRSILNAALIPALEVGEVGVDHRWTWVAFQEPFADPVVVAKSLSYNDSDPAVVRIRNVGSTGFEIRIQEWDYLDGTHVTETIGYLVMERGTYTLADGTMIEADQLETNRTDSFDSIAFTLPFQTVPVVLTTVSSFNGEEAVTGRIRNVSAQSFEFGMQEQEANEQAHRTENISYIAWEPSSGTIQGMTFAISRTEDVITQQFQTILFDEIFTDLPIFIADMQTTNGSNTANLRWQNKDLFGVEVRIAEEQSLDGETYHPPEVIGYLAIW